jgi:hypothetical protein
MLEIAYPHKDKLNKAWQSCAFVDRFKYYNCTPEAYYEIYLDNNSWEKLQMVSADTSENITGYFAASIDRRTNKVSNISAINFGDQNLSFSRDFKDFLVRLFEVYKFNKVEWFVVVGNPAETMYDRIVAKYGGRVTGVKRDAVMLYDGTLCNVKEYELMRCEYEAVGEGEG